MTVPVATDRATAIREAAATIEGRKRLAVYAVVARHCISGPAPVSLKTIGMDKAVQAALRPLKPPGFWVRRFTPAERREHRRSLPRRVRRMMDTPGWQPRYIVVLDAVLDRLVNDGYLTVVQDADPARQSPRVWDLGR